MINLDSQAFDTGKYYNSDLSNGASRAMRVVVAGEVRTGKSSVVNVLARGKVLPDVAGDLASMPIIVRHADEPYFAVQDAEGRVAPIETLEDEENFVEGGVLLVGADIPHLSSVEIVEVPFTHEGDVSDESLALMNSADVLVWLTIASQAWRLSEKSIVEKLTGVGPSQRVLVVSRSDKLRSEKDRGKIRGRLERETEDFFSGVVFMGARPDFVLDSKQNDGAWEKTGGKILFDKVDGFLQSIDLDDIDDAEETEARESNIVELRPRAPEPKEEPAVEEVVTDELEPVQAKVEPQPEPPTKAPETQSDLDGVSGYCQTLTGLVSVGAVSAKGKPKVFFGADDQFEKIAEICQSWSEVDAKFAFSSPEDFVSELTLSGHFLIYRNTPSREEQLFLYCETDKLNASMARRGFARLCALYDSSEI